MRILLAELAPRRGAVRENLARIETLVGSSPAELAVFPELFLSGYKLGDRVHGMALDPGGPEMARLRAVAHRTGCAIVTGAPMRSPVRPGEVENGAVLIDPQGSVTVQGKRFLPTYGPFEEGSYFTPTSASTPVRWGARSVGLEICYDAFFPEVTRELGLAGAALFVAISAAPGTSRSLFDRVLPARAVENATPMVYVNRVGVEDGLVFGGGSAAWDARGVLLEGTEVPFERQSEEERLFTVEIDLDDVPRWRPFRPVLRDAAGARSRATADRPSIRTDDL